MNPHPPLEDILHIPAEYPQFCTSLVSPPREKSLEEINIIHLVYGIVGELLEFRNTCEAPANSIPNYSEELLKEAGDIMFYLSAYGQATGVYIPLNQYTEDVSQEFFRRLFVKVDKFLDLNKKKYFYNNDDSELDVKIRNAFLDLCDTTTLMLHSFFSYKRIIDGNYSKLKARYPEGFSVQASVARADETT